MKYAINETQIIEEKKARDEAEQKAKAAIKEKDETLAMLLDEINSHRKTKRRLNKMIRDCEKAKSEAGKALKDCEDMSMKLMMGDEEDEDY